jgi:hypothetical protein
VDDIKAVFVFELEGPVFVSASVDDAAAEMEGIDVAFGSYTHAFTDTGQVISISNDADLAVLTLTGVSDLQQLKNLLRQARGPSDLADDPLAYANEWLRLEERDRQPLLRRLCQKLQVRRAR